jgi:hypothetical protein
VAPVIAAAQAVAAAAPAVTQAPASALPPGASALDIANAALSAAFGSSSPAKAPPPPPPSQTRILVLLNMVEDDDLSSDENYRGLLEEVEEECAKFGKLLSMKVPRHPSGDVQPSAIKKIYLEYASAQDAIAAERELGGRQFGPNVVQVSFLYSDSCLLKVNAAFCADVDICTFRLCIIQRASFWLVDCPKNRFSKKFDLFKVETENDLTQH